MEEHDGDGVVEEVEDSQSAHPGGADGEDCQEIRRHLAQGQFIFQSISVASHQVSPEQEAKDEGEVEQVGEDGELLGELEEGQDRLKDG